jgi:hypothetical protein
MDTTVNISKVMPAKQATTPFKKTKSYFSKAETAVKLSLKNTPHATKKELSTPFKSNLIEKLVTKHELPVI